MRRPSVRVRLLAPGKPARQAALRVFCFFVPSPRGWICRSSPPKLTPRSPARQTGTRTHCQTLLSAPDGNPPSGAFFGGFARGNPGPGTPGPVAGMISQYRKMSKKGLTNAKSGIIITIPHELNIHINFYYINI